LGGGLIFSVLVSVLLFFFFFFKNKMFNEILRGKCLKCAKEAKPA